MMPRLESSIALSVAAAFFLLAVFGQTTTPGTKKCSPPQPTYQEEAPPPPRSLKHSGAVAFNVLVDEKGHVSEAKIVQSSGSDKYDRDALKAAQKWKFKPSMCDGKAVSAHIVIEMQSHVAH